MYPIPFLIHVGDGESKTWWGEVEFISCLLCFALRCATPPKSVRLIQCRFAEPRRLIFYVSYTTIGPYRTNWKRRSAAE